MKKCMTLIFAVMMLVCSVSGLSEETPAIRVTGNASIVLEADMATLQIGVYTKSTNVREAQIKNAEIMNDVTDAIQNAGVDERDISTTNYNISFEYDYSSEEQKIQYYGVQNTIMIIVKNISNVGKILDAAIDAGANMTYGISFSSSHEQEAYTEALENAVHDAIDKAKVIADAAGVQLMQIKNITSDNNGLYVEPTVMTMKNSMSYDRSGGTSVVSGDITVEASVVMEYEIKNIEGK